MPEDEPYQLVRQDEDDAELDLDLPTVAPPFIHRQNGHTNRHPPQPGKPASGDGPVPKQAHDLALRWRDYLYPLGPFSAQLPHRLLSP